MDFAELLIRIPVSFFVLLCLTRIMGRKEISQMTFFNFASGITIGEIAADIMTNRDFSIREGVLALTGWTVLTLIMAFIDIKSRKTRSFLIGDPLIVIKDGRILEDSLHQSRLDINALKSLLRQKDIFSMADVDYAIFEVDGTLSVLKKEAKETVTKEDLNVQPAKAKLFPLATEVISDGTINTKNLERLNLSREWLNQQLQQAGISSVSDVFYGEVGQDGSLYINKKEG